MHLSHDQKTDHFVAELGLCFAACSQSSNLIEELLLTRAGSLKVDLTREASEIFDFFSTAVQALIKNTAMPSARI